ncbi:MATE family efflux transporter [Eubacteriales bacterium OttesenSCG-928-A19]|nr:MATE family efflux transporter [Eubacteriales bacterium OttesenSCG-928-A19]
MEEKRNEQEIRNDLMLNTPIPKLIPRLAAPTVTSMLVTSIYNMADTYFVSQLGQSASGAVGVVFTLMLFIQAIGFTLGMGSGSNIARLLGAQDEKTASGVASTGFVTSILLGLLLAVGGIIFMEPLVRMLGATETILPYAEAYAQYILIGAPWMAASFVLNNILRSQGNAFWSMIGLTIGGVLNIILDPIFIFALGMGTGGAALATILSQLVSFFILLYMVMRHSAARISLKRVNFRLLGRIIPVGLPSFYRQGLTSIATILLNRAAGVYGDAAIAAMSITSRIMGFCFSALIGFYQGFQPVCGFNYGAKRYDRVREAMLFSMKVTTVAMTVLCVLVMFFAPQLIEIFRRGDTEVIEIGAKALRMQAILLPTMAYSVMTNMSHQSLGMSTQASILALARQGLFFIPAILILPALFGLQGVLLAQPVADVLALLISIPFATVLLRDLKTQSVRPTPIDTASSYEAE